ncbi:hypothetical protein [Brachybacterium sp. AOP29-B2-41]|uniref:hypothetical protein n=1 Tax=Brachybacterium sp. AOP29-B2-41 TaxID=3457704 RepID=UPI0040338969
MASPVRHSARSSAAGSAAGPDAQDPPSQSPGGEPDLQIKKLSPMGLIASGAAAATATVIGGQLGIAGTVIGAALTSVVSATALAFYTDSVTRSTRKLKEVAARGRERPHSAPKNGVHSSRTGARRDRPDDAESAPGALAGMDEAPSDASTTRRRIVKIALLAAVIALIGIGAIFGIQRITGTELSPGTGQIQRSVTGSDAVSPRGDSSSTDDGHEQQDDSEQDISEQGDDQAPATEVPEDSGQGSGGEQDDGTTTDQGGTSGGLDEAPIDPPTSPSGQGDGAGSSGGDSGSGGAGSGE